MRESQRYQSILRLHPHHLSPRCTAATRAPSLVPNRTIKLALIRWSGISFPLVKENPHCVRMCFVKMQPWQRLRTIPLRLHGHSKRRDETRPLKILSSLPTPVPGNGMALWISVNPHLPGHTPSTLPDLPIPRTVPTTGITPTLQMTYSRRGCRLQ